MSSARPCESASSVEKRSTTRSGSSELSTITAVPSVIRAVRCASEASTMSGALTAKSGR